MRWAVLALHIKALAGQSCEDEASMLQMPVKDNSLGAADDTCRCPGYKEADCRAEEQFGCIWTDAGSSNKPWCQCRSDLEPGWVPPRRSQQTVTAGPVDPAPVTAGPVDPAPVTRAPVTAGPVASVQLSWDNHFAAFGGQDVDRVLLDYTEESVITVYNQVTGDNTVFEGLTGVRECFEGLFANLYDISDLTAPVITVKEATSGVPGSVFLIWSAPASGYSEATDTFIFDDSSKIFRQNVVVHYSDPRVMSAAVMVDDTEEPTGSGPVHDGWANHFAAFGGQDVDRILLDYSENSEITVYNHADGSTNIFNGLAGVRNCFEGLFANLFDTSDLAAPIQHVEEGGEVFLIWSAGASGYRRATDTFVFNAEGTITRQHVVVHYEPVVVTLPTTAAPTRPCEDWSVEYQGACYAVIDMALPDSPTPVDVAGGCTGDLTEMPAGYAPVVYSADVQANVAAQHTFGTWRIVYEDGETFGTGEAGSCGRCECDTCSRSNQLTGENGRFRVSSCSVWAKVFIARH